MSFAAALLLLSGSAFDLDPMWKPVADPLAPARAGKVQCHEPDPEARTCRIMTWYSVQADGRAQMRSVSALSDEMALAVEARMTLRPEKGGMCGTVNDAHMASYRIVQMRAPHAPVKNDRLFIRYREELVGALWNRTHCAFNFARAADDMRLDVSTVDGEFAGEMMAQFLWVAPGAGWRLKASAAG